MDVLIIGSGAAGLTLALKLAPTTRIGLISKGALEDSSTFYAQGGIAAVLSSQDSVAKHVSDTLQAGAGLCNTQAVEFTVGRSRALIEWLINQGVQFTREPGEPLEPFHLNREGGHSERRIIHAADATGKAVSQTLIEQLKHH
ncbi:MAG: FAD-binding protein, partial [Pseudomonadota bacterium]|nr:FAD-binding protein [Pseudomonadota bacterium]